MHEGALPAVGRLIGRSLADAGRSLATMGPGESLWQAGVGPSGISSATCYARFRRYLRLAGLPPSGLHVLRHTAAKLRRDAGETVESESAFLDHSSLSVTTVYLRRLEGVEDRSWQKVAAAMGVRDKQTLYLGGVKFQGIGSIAALGLATEIRTTGAWRRGRRC